MASRKGVVTQRVTAQKTSTPKMTPDTLPRLKRTSNVATRLTPTIVSSRSKEAFSGVDGMMCRPVRQAHSHTGGTSKRTSRRIGDGKSSAGAMRRIRGSSAAARPVTRRPDAEAIVGDHAITPLVARGFCSILPIICGR